ncbi:hypothetical protein T265_03409 [Opisthorchis viverrini]|uniref:Uncharacterized protein n=1 Tax=Opisthorchis viverrini TaxID=6198 RepID=A0A075A376_OPIVI|nr:hypothetical protein T265_03409 [Opisthorchis viverrini]KER30030.1 hypothetical protein T265_03409 [Opisthorchis viverrini]
MEMFAACVLWLNEGEALADSGENSYGSAISLGMTVPFHRRTDMLGFMDSPVTVVNGAAIGEGIRSSVAAGSGLDRD